jgi:RNA polymerase sigma factor (sigma-70 family)
MPSSWPEPSQPPTRLRQRLRERRLREAGCIDTTPAIVPVVSVDNELAPALERRLMPTARRAYAGCHDARDALYIAFGPKLERFTRGVRVPRLGSTCTGIWDRDDLEQEAWLVFTEILGQWDTARPFGRFLLTTFPWRLRDAIYRGIGRRGVPPRMALVPIGEHDWLHDGSAAAAEAHVLLNALADRLPEPQATILRRHIGDGESLTVIARELDVSRRTVTRQWRALKHQLAADDDTPPARHMA